MRATISRVADSEEVLPQETRQRALRKQARLNRSLLLPALIFAIVITQIPMLVTLVLSTIQWKLNYPDKTGFTGFSNFVSVFTSGHLWASVKVTVVITSLAIICSLLLGLAFAILLDRKFHGRAIARTLMITPFLLMPAAASLIWKFSMFDTNIGILNWVLRTLGIHEISWVTNHPQASVVIVLTWQFTPFMMLILLAGLQSQSKDILEAAVVDGAGAWRIFTWITLPHLRMYIEIAVLMGAMIIIQVFDPIFILTRGAGETKTVSYLLYERAFRAFNVGEAAAYGVVSVILTIIVATVALRTIFRVFMAGEQR